MKHLRRALPLLLCAACLLGLSAPAHADGERRPFSLAVRIEGGAESLVRAYEDAYEGNLYLNLSDLAVTLRETEKRFTVAYSYDETEGSAFTVTTGRAADLPAAETAAQAERGAPAYLSLMRNRLFVDGGERKYYSFREGAELYLNLVDAELMLDLTATLDETGVLCLYPDRPFATDPAALKAAGYFDGFGAVLVGDAATGELLFSQNLTCAVPIASLSKLMSYVLIMEALEDGRIGAEDRVPISAAAERLSKSADGMIDMTAGKTVPLSELMQAMLLASSNESCLALAEYAAGSEAAFVKAMNEKAAELGLRSAVFYTPHGLPVYSTGGVPAKLQNRMSVKDLFTLCDFVLERWPQITAITSAQYAYLPTLDYTTANSNPMVFNLSGVNGLKTGSTTKAGYCLAASLPVSAADGTHTLVAIVLGAETADVRGQAAEILLRWAQAQYTA